MLNLNTTGLQGFQGNQGFEGPQGTQGSVGSQGLSGGEGGPQGAQGAQGALGTQGVQGVGGAMGLTGTNAVSSSFAIIGDPNVPLLLHMDGANESTTFTDRSYSPRTITANGNTKISTTKSKFGGSSASFDGSNSYLTWANSTDFAFGSGDLTIEGWVNFNGPTIGHQAIFNTHTYGVTGDIGLEIINSTTANMGTNVGGGFNRTIPTISADTWYHFAMVKSGSNLVLYWNGTQAGAAVSVASITNVVPYWVMGRTAWNSGGAYLNGYIDEFRITKGLARYTSNFTPSASAFANADGTGDLPGDAQVGQTVYAQSGIYICSSTSPLTWKKYAIIPSVITG